MSKQKNNSKFRWAV